ncbi:hypothetical protein C8J57DRAFT_1536077 [Mycena rebaudengoi]|nr:hypothetical protein C8J57DRAFT_1536077 [Mycena rebaudengoi]
MPRISAGAKQTAISALSFATNWLRLYGGWSRFKVDYTDSNSLELALLRGHANTERGFLPALFVKLRAELELPLHLAPLEECDAKAGLYTVEVLVRERDTHPLAIV